MKQAYEPKAQGVMTIYRFIRNTCGIAFLVMIISGLTYGQEYDFPVSGQVTDDEDVLVGASIVIEGTTIGVSTDMQGNYEIMANENSVLVFSYLGYETRRIPVDGRNQIDVELTPVEFVGDELVIIGYGTRRVEDVTGAIGIVNAERISAETNSDVLRSVQGQVAGVNITTDGRPGGNANIVIRGMGSIESNSPLFVVDGTPTSDIGHLNPRDIESLQVLKDAASASIYGARASNGVVLISTKSGRKEGMTVSFNTYASREWPRNKLDMLNAREYGEIIWTTLENDGRRLADPVYGSGPEPVIPDYLDNAETIPSADTDWQKETFRPNWNQNYNLAIAGKTDLADVYLSGNYANESGMVIHTDYERYSVRLNTNLRVSDRVEIGENLSFTKTTFTGSQGMPSGAWQQHAIIPLYDDLGNFGGTTKNLGDRLNPVGEMYRQRHNTNDRWGVFGNAFLNIEIFENLHFNTIYGLDYSTSMSKNFHPTFVEGITETSIASLHQNEFQFINQSATTTLNYIINYDDHNFEILTGLEAVSNEMTSLSASSRDFFIEELDYRYIDAGAEILGVGGSGAKNTLLSQFGRIDYNHEHTYYASATFRRDGSSRFGPENRWAIFPSFAASWRISNESFMQGIETLSDFRLRASWGQQGNQEIGNYNFADFYHSVPSYSNVDIEGNNSGTIAQGFMVDQIGNPRIRWETSEQTNIGLDLGVFDNRLLFAVDYFIKDSKDLLVNPELLAVQGEGQPPFINAGDIRNQGIEFQVIHNNDIRDLSYNINLNLTAMSNEVRSVGEDGDGVIIGGYQGSIRIKKGHPIGSFYGYVTDGIFKTQEEVDAHADQPGKGVGRIRFKDLNGDGVIDEQDQQFIGNPHPDFTFGVNMGMKWRRVDFNMFWDGSVGNDIWNNMMFNLENMYFTTNKRRTILDAWSPSNPDSDIPAPSFVNRNDELRPSTYFIDKGSYLRLKSLEIGYTLPETFFNARSRIYLQAQNIFDITTFDGLDYEVITHGPLHIGVHEENVYQHTRSVSLGLDIEF